MRNVLINVISITNNKTTLKYVSKLFFDVSDNYIKTLINLPIGIRIAHLLLVYVTFYDIYMYVSPCNICPRT